MSDGTRGFRPVPWEKGTAELGRDMPPVLPGEAYLTFACRRKWRGWSCTRPTGHDGTHQAGTGTYVVAEWWGESGSA